MVAIVVQIPDLRGEQGGVVTGKDFEHALDQAAALVGLRAAPKPGAKDYKGLKNAAMKELLEDAWIRGQAAEMGVGVRPRQVARLIAEIRQLAFDSQAQYRRSLKEAHITRRDMIERVEVQILAEHIRANVASGLGGKAAESAMSKFIADYEDRWRSRTVCVPGYVTELCANAPQPKRP